MSSAEPHEPCKNPRQCRREPPDALYNADAIEYSDADLPVLLVPRDDSEAAEKIFDSYAVSAVTGPRTPLDLLKGRLVVIWHQVHAKQLAARLKTVGAAEIRMVQIPAGWPAERTIRRGEHDPQVRTVLRKLLDEAQPWKPTTGEREREKRSGNGAGKTRPEWLEPEPIIVIPERCKYPLDALPPGVFEAVKEAVDFDQYPPELAACSAISAMSLAGQGLVNVARNDQLKSPVSINGMVIAQSGERKSTADKRFCGVILDYQKEQAEALKPKLDEYDAAFAAWKSMCTGVNDRIKKNKKEGKNTTSDEKELKELKGREPIKPRVPTVYFGDVTKEGLAYSLHAVWPSAGLISAEGGVVLGSHAAQNETVMGFLAMTNVLWDGAPYSVTRRQSESYFLDMVRFTMGIAVQHDTVKAFHERTGGISRGIGFLARFLIACPESTAGTREWQEPETMPNLGSFRARIKELLTKAPPPDPKTGRLISLKTLMFSREGKKRWVEAYNEIERRMGAGSDLEFFKDIGSKAAENVARLAALFHIYQKGAIGDISEDNVDRAYRIVLWHLQEAKRFLGVVAAPAEQCAALELEDWLVRCCNRRNVTRIPTGDALQNGPIRKKADRDTAIKELAAVHRARIETEDKKKFVAVNPRLLGK